MTKKKIIIYTIIFIIAICGSYFFKSGIENDPSELFNDSCKMVLAPSCQNYIMDISAEKKYEEAITIQKVRIDENKKLVKFYKNKLENKSLLKMEPTQVEDTLKACIDTPVCKNDYFIIKTAEFTVNDIMIDSLAVAQIQYSEFKNTKAALKTLKDAKKVLNQNSYVANQEQMQKYIDKELSELK